VTAITLNIFDNLNPVNPIESVVVRFYNQAGDTFVTQLTSGSDGSITTDLPDATYWVRFYKTGYYFPSKLLIEVADGETNEWSITGNDLTILPPSGADDICRVSGFIIDAQGAPSGLPIVTFGLLSKYRIGSNRIIGTEKVKSQPNKDGYIEVELLQGKAYSVTMPVIGDEVINVLVPNLQQCDILDLVYPRGVISGNIPSSISVTSGQKFTTNFSVALSSGARLDDNTVQFYPEDLLRLSASSGLSAEIGDSNLISVTAESAGTYSLKIYSKYAYGDVGVDEILIATVEVVAT